MTTVSLPPSLFARHVYIPTTKGGPVRITSIIHEEEKSTAHIGGSWVQAGMSPGYHAFVKRPGGVVNRVFNREPYPFYRLDLEDNVDIGESWELAVFIAHGCIAHDPGRDDDLIWATATVSNDLRVGAVAEISRKLLVSRELFEDARDEGRKVHVILSKENEVDLEANAARMLEGLGIVPTFVSRVDAALAVVGLPPVEAAAASKPKATSDVWKGNPFPNLQPYDRAHRAVFFGRSRAREEAGARLKASFAAGRPFLLVHGESGAGKSSFVRAGVAGDMEDHAADPSSFRTQMTSPRAAETPLDALLDAMGTLVAPKAEVSATLRSVSEVVGALAGLHADPEAQPTLLLVLDQLEEVLDASVPPLQVTEFDGALADIVLSGRVWVVATIRSDAIGQLDRLPRIAKLATDERTYRLKSPTPSELVSIVSDPVLKAGGRFEDDRIVDELVEAAARSPDSLPLLQVVMFRFFDFSGRDRVLTRGTLETLGGFEGAIALWADRAFGEIVRQGTDAATVDAALASLVRVDPETKKPMNRTTPLPLESATGAALSALVEKRLATRIDGPDGPRVRLAHEALLTRWPHLSDLVSRLAVAMAVRDDLERRTRSWEHGGGDEAELMRTPAKLETARAFLTEGLIPVDPSVARYVAASAEIVDADRKRAEEFAALELAGMKLERDAATLAQAAADERTKAAHERAGAARRLQRILTAGAIGFAVTAAVVGWQWKQAAESEQRAVASQGIAESERGRAERNFTLAQETLNGIVFDIAQGLKDVEGMTVASRTRILDQVRESVDQLATSSSDDPRLLRTKAAALSLLGDAYEEGGDAARAYDAFAEGLSIFRKLAALYPYHMAYQRDVSVSLDNVGEFKLRSGDPKGAEAAFVEQLAIDRKLLESDPTEILYRRAVSQDLTQVGDLKERAGDLVGAMADYAESLSLAREVVLLDPDNEAYQRDISVSLDKVGDLKGQSGDIVGAEAANSESLAIARRLATFNPTSTEYQRDISVSLDKISALRIQTDDVAGARDALTESLAIRRKLAALDTASTDNKRQVSTTLARIADLELEAGNVARAESAYAESLVIQRALVKIDPTNMSYKRDVFVGIQRMADLKVQAGDAVGAKSAFDESATIIRELAAIDPDNMQYQLDLTVTLGKIGDLEENAGDFVGAEAAGNESLSISRKLVAFDPTNTKYQRSLSVTLDEIGGLKSSAKDIAAAKEAYDESLAIKRRLSARDPTNTEYQMDISLSLGFIGGLKQQAGDTNGAVSDFAEGLSITRKLGELNPTKVRYRAAMVVFNGMLGDLKLDAGDLAGAGAAYTENLALSRELAALDPTNARYRSYVSDSVERLSGLTWSQLLAHDWNAAKKSSEAVASSGIAEKWLNINVAHVLMLGDDVDEARRLYLSGRGTEVPGFGRWEDVVVGDFAALRAAKLDHPLMAEIEAVFAAD